ncbi:MAG: hypothetical protein A2504_13690 [Bdellovibrionales bacterium RIFOXYD12_FULL_39_22]|nr:MAG: hypothetical protein A2385_00415 [Bdellovibrionales bacterium RIFOXYB1_FULL_39_21]OFZ43860.1 MAG: hypothetical protein A2485_05115 [Bdellovibrionales bacterium RIFOXYC12_FULL_39_17]OFZ48806.1 MAG: hypothetical protein A2404_17730 [Bdellovibrionales bacterium RIFOXYC1_FULL_39_130]OFZ69439.1 MAG: hypothetical protein A2451_10860 [Bdellovibrionales bacterium RIFOXYC2_FULL_39_8]OFZ76539.1 MAG: hypothetical protein A2560_06395 [Bdellovibrionales bacterium RIFOXYD1_FULL_39_84]OFZ94773.1 MAG:
MANGRIKLLFFLSLFFLIFNIATIEASQTAYISSDTAVIYADSSLTAPIGFARNGRQVLVGEVPRKNGTVLPIYVSGKIGYIKISDIITEGGKREKSESEMTSITRATDIPEEKNSAIELTYAQTALGSDWNKFSQTLGEESNDNAIYNYRLAYQYLPDRWNLFLGLGISYSTILQERVAYAHYAIDATLYWSLFRTSPLALDLYVGGFAIPAFLVDLQINNKIETQEGWGLGNMAGAQLRFFPGHLFNLIIGADYRVAYTKSSSKNPEIEFEGFDGISFFGGLSVRF